MKILAINNYEIDIYVEKAKHDITPANHCWGVDYLISQGEEVDMLVYKQSASNRWMILLQRLWFNIKLVTIIMKYDVVVSFYTPVIDFVGLFFKLFPIKHPRLFELCHHEVKSWQLKGNFERIFFISHGIMKRYNAGSDKLMYLEWGPDIPFYREYKEKHLPSKVTFFTGGKTNRDDTLVEKVCKKMKVPLIMINSNFVKKNGIVCQHNDHKWGNIVSYHDMLDLMRTSDVSIIPVVPSLPKERLCGLTSFDDAIAMGHCILMSDNTNISVDIEKYRMGLYYKAGDENDLKSKVMFLTSHPEVVFEYGRNARAYAETHSYRAFCEKLYASIKE